MHQKSLTSVLSVWNKAIYHGTEEKMKAEKTGENTAAEDSLSFDFFYAVSSFFSVTAATILLRASPLTLCLSFKLMKLISKSSYLLQFVYLQMYTTFFLQHPLHLWHKLQQHHVIPQSSLSKGAAYFIFIPSEERGVLCCAFEREISLASHKNAATF